MHLSKKSFTLIEMLIVIVIIGILAAALVPRLQAVQSRARDTRRKVDMRNYSNAIEIKFLDVGTYQPSLGWLANDYTILNGYVTALTNDPLSSNVGYQYRRKDWDILTAYGCTVLNNPNKYAWYAKLETPTNADTGSITDIFDTCIRDSFTHNIRAGN